MRAKFYSLLIALLISLPLIGQVKTAEGNTLKPGEWNVIDGESEGQRIRVYQCLSMQGNVVLNIFFSDTLQFVSIQALDGHYFIPTARGEDGYFVTPVSVQKRDIFLTVNTEMSESYDTLSTPNGDLDEWIKEIWKADTLTIVGMRVGTYEGNKAPKKLEMTFNAKTLRAKIVEGSSDDVGEVAVLLRAGAAKVQVKK